jgi:hypothetical protein
MVLASDSFQAGTWYAAADTTLYRTLNNGNSWEPSGIFDDPIDGVRPHTGHAGIVALSTRLKGNAGSRIYASQDCGETWSVIATTGFTVDDLAWTIRDGAPLLFLATSAGLFELPLRSGSSPLQVQADPTNPSRPFVAVVTATDSRGQVSVAVAADSTQGVYLSSDGGKPGSFRLIGLPGQDVRTLAVQIDGPRTFLWAGVAATGGEDPGKGCFSWELRGSADPPEGWQAASTGWNGGSCWALAFKGTTVLAGSHRSGVLRFDTSRRATGWVSSEVDCGLPLRDRTRFQPIRALAVDPGERIVLAGGPQGVFDSKDGITFASASQLEFGEKVTLPDTWLFCSGDPEITVVSEDEAERS